jgi:uncharacterized membrane protein YdjX (TVP38/TMEM64 family)
MQADEQAFKRLGGKRLLVFGLILLVVIVLIALLIKDALPLLKEVLANTSNESATVTAVDKLGTRGVVMIALLQAIATSAAFLPSTPIQVLAGLVYGKWGIAIILVGMLLGNAALFLAVRYGGQTIHDLLPEKHKHPPHKFLDLDRLNAMKHPGLVVFIVHLVPGLPNSMLSVVLARTKITLRTFLFWVALGEIPPLAITVGLGSSIASQNKTLIYVLGAVLALILLIGLIFHKRILAYLGERPATPEAPSAH